jgi:hypothetical protein
MGLNTSVQQFVEILWLNDINRYLSYFPEQNPKQLDQDERYLEWHEVMFNVNIEIFEMPYELSASHFKYLENLEKIRCTNGSNPSSLPVDNKISVTSSVGKSSKNHKRSNIWCLYCDANNQSTSSFLSTELI